MRDGLANHEWTAGPATPGGSRRKNFGAAHRRCGTVASQRAAYSASDVLFPQSLAAF
jgi:hypothetical protein